MTTRTWSQRLRAFVSRQRAMVVGAAVLLGLVGVGAPLAGSAAGGPYDDARIACAVTGKLTVDVKGSGFPAHSPAKLTFKSLGRVVATVSTTTSASGSFTSLITVPLTVVSGEITATVKTSAGSVVGATCSVRLSL